MKGTTTKLDIFRSQKNCIEKHGLLWNRPDMCSSNVSVLGSVKIKSGFELLHPHFQLFSTPFDEKLQMELTEL